MLFKSNIRRDGSCPVCLRVAKEDKTKYIDLQLSATKGQWDELASRFKKDKRVNPNYENYNALLNRYKSERMKSYKSSWRNGYTGRLISSKRSFLVCQSRVRFMTTSCDRWKT